MDLIGIIEQGLIASLAAIGVFISFRVVDLPDLTLEFTPSLLCIRWSC